MMKVAFVLSLVFLVFGAEAKIEMGAPFADGMVLQRGMKVPVWGRVVPDAEDLAKPSEGGPKVALPGKRKITVSFAGQEKTGRIISRTLLPAAILLVEQASAATAFFCR